MPPSGGLADKIGNRYEGRLAVLRLLQLLDEEHDSVRMRLEQPGEDSFEWWVERGDASRTHAQVKRQLSTDDQWKIALLAGKGIIKDFGTRIRNESTARCEFYSTLSASHLQELSENAHMAGSLQQFEDVFAASEEKKKSRKRICDEWDWWSPEESWRALRQITVGAIGEPLLETHLKVQARMLVSGNPETFVSLLGSYLEDHLCQEITAQDLWSYLADNELAPSDWERTPAPGPRPTPSTRPMCPGLQGRTEADTTAGLLISSDREPRLVTVTGVAGAGKPDLLGQVVEQLTTPSADAAAPKPLVLAAWLDRLAGSSRTPPGLGAVLGLPESPAMVLSRLAAGRRCCCWTR